MKKRNEQLINKLIKVRKTLNNVVYERHSETDGILLSILSGASCLFVGDVGTAKTFHIVVASKLLGLTTFDILLSETTKPEHVFGPTDIPALAKGKQYTKVKGYAPDAEVLFFDEIFKANGIVLNPLLWLINEHKYRNGDKGIMSCPTKAVFAASNEITTDPSLRAIYDRLTLRYKVDYLEDSDNVKRMINSFLTKDDEIKEILNREEVEKLRRLVHRVKIPEEIKETVIKIRDQIQIANNVNISDRRLANSFRIIQANAILNKRLTAVLGDVEILANVFWDRFEHYNRVQSIVLSSISADIADLLSYEEMANSIWEKALKTGDMKTARTKLKGIHANVSQFSTKSGKEVAGKINARIKRIRNIVKKRNEFIVFKMNTEGKTWYKLSVACSSLWTQNQLREVGFKWRRKYQYWWYPGSLKTLNKKLYEKLDVKKATVKKMSDI